MLEGPDCGYIDEETETWLLSNTINYCPTDVKVTSTVNTTILDDVVQNDSTCPDYKSCALKWQHFWVLTVDCIKIYMGDLLYDKSGYAVHSKI